MTSRRSRRGTQFDMDPARRGFLFEHDEDLYYATFDGKTAVRLTSQPGREQWPAFSPDGKHVAYVRDYDLYAVDIATQAERRLTTGGREDLRHGHSDWVYFEEIWNRRWPAFWWSADSKRLAFMEFDNSAVPYHTVLDDASSGTARNVERTHYPRAGEPNPKVRLGIVGGEGGAVQWADLSDYSPDSSLISEVGWFPDGSAYCYVQDRAQTWLDLVKVTPSSGGEKAATRRLFRDATKGYIDSPGPLHMDKDGSFLWISERDGWKHIYQYAADGTLKARVTSGPWEVRRIEHVDTKDGWITFTASREAPMSTDLYRVKPGGPIERLTQSPGTHTANVSPDGKLFLSSRSDIRTPDRIGLYCGRRQAGAHDRLEPVARDEAVQVRPARAVPDPGPRRLRARGRADPADRHGAGQEVPGLVHDLRRPARADGLGRLERRPDAGPRDGPRGAGHLPHGPASASGKGAVSTWTAYKHLGVQETKDIEDAINWLKQKPYVDGDADRHERPQLRRLHHVVRHDPHEPVRRGDRRRTGDRLARLRLDLHRALHGPAAGQPRRLQRLVGRPGGRQAARPAADPPRRDRRQRLVAEHHEAGPRAPARQQGLRADDLPVVAARHRRRALQPASRPTSSAGRC